MAIINTDRKSVNIENVHVTVTCPNCGETFGICIKRPRQHKNCYCSAGGFELDTSARKGVVEVLVAFIWNNSRRDPLEPNDIAVQEV